MLLDRFNYYRLFGIIRVPQVVRICAVSGSNRIFRECGISFLYDDKIM